MGFESKDSGIAASIFLSLYVIYTALAINIVIKEGWRSVYTTLLIHGIFRVAGQLCGVAFAALGWAHWQFLIAYLVFSAEGYFVLILSAYHFIARAQYAVIGYSWIRPCREDRKAKVSEAKTFTDRLRARLSLYNVFHYLLIPANSFIISGGSMLSGLTIEEINGHSGKLVTSRVLRTVGQSIFLFQTCVAIFLAFRSYFVEKISHEFIYAVFIVAPFLLVRGVFGILSIYLDKMDYFLLSNYTAEGLASSFVAYEYIMGTTMEFVSATVFISTYYINRRLTKKREGDIETFQEDLEEKKVDETS